MTIQSWFCYFELFRVYSFSPSSGIHCGLLITSLCLKSSQRSWIWPFCSRNISIRFCRNEAIWNTLIQTNKQPNEQVSWWNLGAEGIADKELLLGCHLSVEEPQLLPVEICLPLVSSSYPPGGVEVEDTLRTFLKIALCQTTTYLGHWSPIKHLVPKITFRVSQGWPSGSGLATVILQPI